jgi:hypothetical protein
MTCRAQEVAFAVAVVGFAGGAGEENGSGRSPATW